MTGPPFFIVIDRSIPPDEVHFRQAGKTVGVMKLGDGQVLAVSRRVEQVPVVGSLLSAVKLDSALSEHERHALLNGSWDEV